MRAHVSGAPKYFVELTNLSRCQFENFYIKSGGKWWTHACHITINAGYQQHICMTANSKARLHDCYCLCGYMLRINVVAIIKIYRTCQAHCGPWQIYQPVCASVSVSVGSTYGQMVQSETNQQWTH